ncbi:52 kDa repressor of the inhibitor of the protein kinase-like [Xenia sp. Carnegie-2017]|uniref:52 kDa repressor of the inhibitor of the protein kinase-like n=1 Tax=Xenia sp. Carnegie-2017 TaxID=2897299 RepID=UPI001F0487B8|nr:52 kDa repressor of the inhibitor of the protein kinase-like [Xenia sp. Carnegie-2017]
MFTDDLPNPIALDGELELWETYWKSKEQDCLPDNISSTLKAINFPGFENIKVLLRILGIIPVTSCECLRSFSALRRLKEESRSRMVKTCLNGLALLYIQNDI